MLPTREMRIVKGECVVGLRVYLKNGRVKDAWLVNDRDERGCGFGWKKEPNDLEVFDWLVDLQEEDSVRSGDSYEIALLIASGKWRDAWNRGRTVLLLDGENGKFPLYGKDSDLFGAL